MVHDGYSAAGVWRYSPRMMLSVIIIWEPDNISNNMLHSSDVIEEIVENLAQLMYELSNNHARINE